MISVLRLLLISLIGAAIGVLMIYLGFNLRFGGYGSTWWLSAPDAYVPSAIAGAAGAIAIDAAVRKIIKDCSIIGRH